MAMEKAASSPPNEQGFRGGGSMKTAHLAVLVLSICAMASFAGAGGDQLYADLGDFTLESGEVIPDLRIGYRTFGELNAEKSNAVLFPTWFTGTTADLVEWGGPGQAGGLHPALRDPGGRHWRRRLDLTLQQRDAARHAIPRVHHPRHGAISARAAHPGAGDRSPPGGDGRLDGGHAVLSVGRGVSRLHGQGHPSRGFAASRFLRPSPVDGPRFGPSRPTRPGREGTTSRAPADGLETVAAIIPLARSTRDGRRGGDAPRRLPRVTSRRSTNGA